MVTQRDTTIKLLEQKVDLLIKRIYRKSSEKLSSEDHQDLLDITPASYLKRRTINKKYRLESILKTRHKIHLLRQTLNRWNTATADRLTCIDDADKSEILNSNYLQADETPIR